MRGLLNNLIYEIAGIVAMIIVYTIIFIRSTKASFIKKKVNKNTYTNR